MAAHNTLGKDGEDAAVAYLERNGYIIRHRNWRKNHLELDIVAVKDELLIVVAADAYIKHFSIDIPVRFDIITAVGEAGAFEIEHIKDAFYPPMF